MTARPCLPRRAILLTLPWLLDGCGGAPPPPATLTLDITAAADQNPQADGSPAPVSVTLYQLAAAGRFERAEVFALSEREAATLGGDLLQSERFVLAPGERRGLSRTLKPGAQFLGAAVLFRDIDRAQWRAVAPLAASGASRLGLAIGRLSVRLS